MLLGVYMMREVVLLTDVHSLYRKEVSCSQQLGGRGIPRMVLTTASVVSSQRALQLTLYLERHSA